MPRAPLRRTTATRTSCLMRPGRLQTPTCNFVPPISTPRYMHADYGGIMPQRQWHAPGRLALAQQLLPASDLRLHVLRRRCADGGAGGKGATDIEDLAGDWAVFL